MMKNDLFGCCTAAGGGHLKILWNDRAGHPVTITDNDVIQMYEDVTEAEGARFSPMSGINDNGCAELDVLVELARSQPGCLGARLTGGGFGGKGRKASPFEVETGTVLLHEPSWTRAGELRARLRDHVDDGEEGPRAVQGRPGTAHDLDPVDQVHIQRERGVRRDIGPCCLTRCRVGRYSFCPKTPFHKA